ncbi:MAG: hypothetical protein V4691_03425 [Pseudomonadota bacterium]
MKVFLKSVLTKFLLIILIIIAAIYFFNYGTGSFWHSPRTENATSVDAKHWLTYTYGHGLGIRRGNDGRVLLMNTLSTTFYSVDSAKHSYQILNTILNDNWRSAKSKISKCYDPSADPSWKMYPHSEAFKDEKGIVKSFGKTISLAGRHLADFQQSPSGKMIAILSSAGATKGVLPFSGGMPKGPFYLQILDTATGKLQNEIYNVPYRDKSTYTLCWLYDENAIAVYNTIPNHIVIVDLNPRREH